MADVTDEVRAEIKNRAPEIDATRRDVVTRALEFAAHGHGELPAGFMSDAVDCLTGVLRDSEEQLMAMVLRAEQAPAAVELRPVVLWFAQQMELKLRENEHKGGWHHCDVGVLRARIGEELRELGYALRRAFAAQRGSEKAKELDALVIRESADVGAMAMMVADHFREGGPSQDQGRTL